MKRTILRPASAACGFLFACGLAVDAWQNSAGLFDGHGDVGTVLHPGSVEYDSARKTYTVAGSGENMWFGTDAFQFVWKKVSGDVALTADVSFVGTGGNAHRKAALMVRQSLDSDSVYGDVALHGDGLTSLQFRDSRGANTHEVQANTSRPARLRLEKRGQTLFMWLASDGEALRFSGASARVRLEEPFYLGIGVCSHDKDAVEKVIFSNVSIEPIAGAAGSAVLYSTVETVPISSGDRRAAYVAAGRIEAPVWTSDGASLLFNGGGRILRIPASGGKAETIETGSGIHCNSHHGISPDGKWLAISSGSPSLIYIVPAAGGEARRVTRNGPSDFGGWSPDSQTIAFAGERGGKTDVYTIPVAGGEETRLTAGAGTNDGPEFSPDGASVYFTSDRTGRMQVWRMKPDGAAPEQVTADGFHNRHPHISPDGQRVVMLSSEEELGAQPGRDVLIRVLSLKDKKTTVLASLAGGQGTLDAAPWSPDGKRVAFVSYHFLPQEGTHGR